MKVFLRTVAASLGMTTLCLLWVVGPLASPARNVIYHWSGPPATIFVPVILDFVGCWLLLGVLFVLGERYQPFRLYLWTCIPLLLPWILLKNATVLGVISIPTWASWLLLASSLIALPLRLTLWRRALQLFFEPLQGFMYTLFCFAAVPGLIMLCQLLWFWPQARGLNSEGSGRPVPRAALSGSTGPRVIWILFDELSYSQVYEQRYPGLKLPAFDQLASQGTIFTHVIPAGFHTEEVLPALMTGRPVDRISSSAAGLLSTHTTGGSWKKFDQHQTVFQDAVDAGYRAGIAGWYNPYCRILPDVLDRCFWAYSQPMVNHMNSSFSVRENLIAPFRTLGDEPLRLHLEEFRELSQAADAMLHDPSLNFILLHMPIPHPMGIYNRAAGNFAIEPTSYIDNLALADLYLAHVRDALERSGEWDSSTIIVMGDHSWRTHLWMKTGGWTAEDQRASHGGQFDDRPAYIVKLPYQHRPARIDSPVEALRTRQMVDAMIHGKISDADGLAAWAR